MEEKLKQANDNIETLVKEIVKMRREKNEMYCVHPREKYDIENFCEDKCEECKDKYYNEVKEYLLEKYQVKTEQQENNTSGFTVICKRCGRKVDVNNGDINKNIGGIEFYPIQDERVGIDCECENDICIESF